MKLFLSERDVELSRRVADIRNSKNGKVPNYRETRRHSDWEIHYAGIRGEVAVCNHYSFPLDQHYSAHGDNGAPDLYVGELRCEVKVGMYTPDKLTVMMNRLTDFKSDVLILCHTNGSGHRDESIVTVIGCVSRVRFIKHHHIQDFGYGERVCVPGTKLSPLSVLPGGASDNAHTRKSAQH